MNRLDLRNWSSVQQVLDDMNQRLYAQHVRLETMHTALTTLIGRTNDLERTLALRKAEEMGHGPTVT